MLTIKIWCLPKGGEDWYKTLFARIVSAVVDSKLFPKIISERDMRVLFPADMMSYGLGSDVLVEATMLPDLDKYLDFAKVVFGVLHEAHPDAEIEFSIPRERGIYLDHETLMG